MIVCDGDLWYHTNSNPGSPDNKLKEKENKGKNKNKKKLSPLFVILTSISLLSLIEIIFINYQTNKLQYNY